MATVLALDRDTLQLDMLASLLRHDRHQLLPVVDARRALAILRSEVVDLVLVDPDRQPEDLDRFCEEISHINPDLPVMVLSERRDEAYIVRALQRHVDDYMTKPFSPHQLLARVSALLRRSQRIRERRQEEILASGEIELNLIQMHALINGSRVPLTPRELWLLHALMSHAGRVLSRDQLMRLAWGEQFIGVSKTVDVCVQRVRKKLAPYLTSSCIHALRGFGYKFQAEAADKLGASPAPVASLA